MVRCFAEVALAFIVMAAGIGVIFLIGTWVFTTAFELIEKSEARRRAGQSAGK